MALGALLRLAAVVDTVRGRSEYGSSIPNGYSVRRDGATWYGVGHESSYGSGPLNAFGEAFRDAGRQWTQALCQADSDGDGQSNGFELGDPDCTWSGSGAAARTTMISHPGYADSMSEAPAPTSRPTPSPLPSPTPAPTLSPTARSTPAPTIAPSSAPTPSPLLEPSSAPTIAPSSAPTPSPLLEPSPAPSPVQVPLPTPAPTITGPTPSPFLVPSPAPSPAQSPSPTPAQTTQSPLRSLRLSFRLEGLDFDGLAANASLAADVVDELRASIAEFANLTDSETVSVVLSRAEEDSTEIITDATIAPILDSFDETVLQLGYSSPMATYVRQATRSVQGIESVTNDEIRVLLLTHSFQKFTPLPQELESIDPEADGAPTGSVAGVVLMTFALRCLSGTTS